MLRVTLTPAFDARQVNWSKKPTGWLYELRLTRQNSNQVRNSNACQVTSRTSSRARTRTHSGCFEKPGRTRSVVTHHALTSLCSRREELRAGSLRVHRGAQQLRLERTRALYDMCKPAWQQEQEIILCITCYTRRMHRQIRDKAATQQRQNVDMHSRDEQTMSASRRSESDSRNNERER